MVIALRLASVHRRCVDRDIHDGLGDVLIVPGNRSRDVVEFAAHRRNHQVLYRKLRGSVLRVDPPTGTRGQRRQRQNSCESCGCYDS